MGCELSRQCGLQGGALLGWAARNGFGGHLPGFAALFQVPLDGRDGDLKGGGNLSLAMALIHCTHDPLAQIVRIRSHASSIPYRSSLLRSAVGAEDPELAKRSAWAALRPCFIFMLGMGICALLLPQFLLSLFVADNSVVQAGTPALRFSLLTLPALAISFIFNGSLRGAGDTKFPVLVRAAGTWGLRMPIALALIPWLGLPGARLAMAADFWVQAALSWWRFRSGRWRKAYV